jgi:phosphoglycolate phosphatase-like HAD superfamily hydrolase
MKNIIFDWSGVVKDAVTSQVWLVNRFLTRNGIENLSVEKFKEEWVQPYDLFYKKYVPSFSHKDEGEYYKEGILSPDCPKAEPFTEVVELIKVLKKRGYHLALVSSDFPETITKEMEEYGLVGMFDDVVTDVHNKTESVKNLIEKYNFKPEETYFIGDSNHEVEVARELGIIGVAVTWGLCNEKRLVGSNPHYLVTTVKELEAILLV